MGLTVELFEAVPQPQPIGAGLLLQPTGQRVLAQMGLLDGALALGARVDHLFGDTPSGREVLNMSYRRFAPDAYGLGLQRGALMGLLWQRLRDCGVAWHCGMAVDRFAQYAHGVELFSQGRSVGSFDALILANGSFSALRQQMQGLRQRSRQFPWGALWTVLPIPDGFPALELRQRFRAARQMLGLMPVGRSFGAVPAERPGMNLFWSLPLAEMDAALAQGLPRWKQQLIDLLPLCAPLLDGLSDAAQLRQARYADVWMSRWHDGRVLALGDCAHAMSPQLGQGANMALIDAHVLAAQLASQPDWPAAFAGYSAARRAHIRYYSQASRGLTPLFQSHQRLLPGLRDVLMGPAGRLPWVHEHQIATLSGYKTGWLWGRLKV